MLLLLTALAGGGYYVYRQVWPGIRSAPAPLEPSLVQEPYPANLPAPTLATEEVPAESDAPLAQLIGMERQVKAKRAAELVWQQAHKKMDLFENDAIRTFERASALIFFGEDGLLEVEENALVIIRPPRWSGAANEISLALLSGNFLKQFAGKPASVREAAIRKAAAQREVTIQTIPGRRGSGEKGRAKVKALPDNSTVVQAVAGSLKLIGPKGREVILNENMVTKISENGTILKPRRLPSIPTLVSPREGATYSFQNRVPRVDLKWKMVEGASRYRIVVAHDRSFRNIFAEERIAGTSLRLRNLRPGTYYWRVRSLDRDDFEGPYSPSRSLKAVRDDKPPDLAILSPPELFVSPKPMVELTGKTDRGARVKVNGEKVKVESDGTFRHLVRLKEGINLVTVEATDLAGNSEYMKRLITFKGARSGTIPAATDSR